METNINEDMEIPTIKEIIYKHTAGITDINAVITELTEIYKIYYVDTKNHINFLLTDYNNKELDINTINRFIADLINEDIKQQEETKWKE